ncbi:amidohydrolase family protein [Actinomadura sp. DC4]|uniref:amidohydrolase family protein n=1 Tax=Actinomadura sp. DC4 TaxID=3055069 RepID=UPI0025B09DE4|nr:amidohydrolase family protein [Actinomadura sp. DC4]MDN3354107.1 amidohydrolase family protein [Actinomadura sp. DC4]
MPTADIHTHIISPDTERYPIAPMGGNRSSWSVERPVDLDGLLRNLDEAAVEKAVVVQASTAYGFDNSYAADSIAGHEDRLIGVCSVDFLAGDALDRIAYWTQERGFAGVRIRAADGTTPVGRSTRLDDPRLEPVWSHLEAERIPVCVQMHSHHAPTLLSVLGSFPDLVIALDHGARPRLDGGPPYAAAEELFGLAAYKGVFLKITPVTVQRADKEPGGDGGSLVRRLVDGFGSERVAWGSNFPASKGALADLRGVVEGAIGGLTEEERSDILGRTAARIYPRLAV